VIGNINGLFASLNWQLKEDGGRSNWCQGSMVSGHSKRVYWAINHRAHGGDGVAW